MDSPTPNRAFGHIARILVDIDISKRAFKEILVERDSFSFKVEVQYERRPLLCHHCYIIEHNVATCKWLHPKASKENDRGKKPMDAEPLTQKPPRQHRNNNNNDISASTFDTLRYVVVAAPTAAATVVNQ